MDCSQLKVGDRIVGDYIGEYRVFGEIYNLGYININVLRNVSIRLLEHLWISSFDSYIR